jgi:hypothetical protein
VEDYIGVDDTSATGDILIDAKIIQHSLRGEFEDVEGDNEAQEVQHTPVTLSDAMTSFFTLLRFRTEQRIAER